MLILNRRVGESIFIGDDIEITICPKNNYRGNIRLGITAPKEVKIVRKEISHLEAKI